MSCTSKNYSELSIKLKLDMSSASQWWNKSVIPRRRDVLHGELYNICVNSRKKRTLSTSSYANHNWHTKTGTRTSPNCGSPKSAGNQENGRHITILQIRKCAFAIPHPMQGAGRYDGKIDSVRGRKGKLFINPIFMHISNTQLHFAGTGLITVIDTSICDRIRLMARRMSDNPICRRITT